MSSHPSLIGPKALAAAAVAACLAAAGWFIAGSGPAPAGAAPEHSPSRPAPPVAFDIRAVAPRERPDVLQRASERRPGSVLDAQRLQDAAAHPELMSYIDPKEAALRLPHLTPEERNDGRVFVSYAPYVLESRGVGETIDVLLPQAGLSLKGRVDRVEVDGDIVRWVGSWPDMPAQSGRFVIAQTLKDQYAHAVYETAMGTYEMEAKDGTGWVQDQRKTFHLPADGTDALPAPKSPHSQK